jgi:hypothetical protein
MSKNITLVEMERGRKGKWERNGVIFQAHKNEK